MEGTHDDGVIRQFATGANRNSDNGKYDFEGFLSPRVIGRFAEYMHKNRHLADGTLRDSDNWQNGIPKKVYVKSLWRHGFDVWNLWRAGRGDTDAMEEALCGVLFNAMGILHEILGGRGYEAKTHEG